MDKFPSMLRRLRHEKELTQTELANVLGLSKSSVSMYENGNREPDFETIEKLSDFFNVDMNYLLGWNTDRKHHIEEDWTLEELKEIEWFKSILRAKRKELRKDCDPCED